jgi:hypothetical protein
MRRAAPPVPLEEFLGLPMAKRPGFSRGLNRSVLQLTDQSIWWSSLEKGQWTPQQVVNGVGTSCRPALAAWKGLLYMAWKGAHNDSSIWWSAFDGNAWGA